MQRRTEFHSDHVLDSVEQLSRNNSVVVSAPTGIGRSYFLERVNSSIGHKDSVVINAANASALTVLRTALPTATILVDSLEHADPEFVRSWLEHLQRGGRGLAVLHTDNQHSSFHLSVEALRAGRDGLLTALDAAHSIQLPPLSANNIERLLHEHSPRILDSGTIHAIVSLAEGRPRWALALLELSNTRGLSVFPRPMVPTSTPAGIVASVLRSIADSVGDMPPSTVAAASVVSQLGQMDLAGIEDLVGSDNCDALVSYGALIGDETQTLYRVPPLLAAAVRSRASATETSRFEDAVQRRLLRRRSLGFPLSVAESLFCTRPFQNDAAANDPTLEEQRTAAIEQSIVELVNFGEHKFAESLLLRQTDAPVLIPPPLRAAVLGALVSPEAGLAHIGPPPGEPGTNAYLGWLGLHSKLNELALTPVAREHSPTMGAEEAATQTIIQVWNGSEPVAHHLDSIREISSRDSNNALGLLADTLLDLEAARTGQVIAGSWLSTGAPAPRASTQVLADLPHTSGTLLLSQALSALFIGQGSRFAQELRSESRRTHLHEFHARWVRHYAAATTAIACGDLARSVIEWSELVKCAPHLVPLRLEAYLHETLATLEAARAAADSGHDEHLPPSSFSAPYALFLCFGNGKPPLLQHQLPPPSAATAPVPALLHKYVCAALEENPKELIRTADALLVFEAWGPALSALRQARDIYVSRRATTAATECKSRLEELERFLEKRIPNYEADPNRSDERIRLTNREKETASLAAEGLSNKEIAARLHCSIRTVESHISQARAKLGLQSRKDLAQVAMFAAPSEHQDELISQGNRRTESPR